MQSREMTYEEFEAATRIIAQRKDFERRHDEWVKNSSNTASAFRTEQQRIQASCKHWFADYHGDPAGGSDSFERCRICGKEAKTL